MSPQQEVLDAATRVADAVLYEGYLLYPYRASSSKNQVRWQFGVLGPAGAVDAMVGEDPSIYLECLCRTAPEATVDVRLRFLQTQWRAVEKVVGEAFLAVDQLDVDGARWIAWHEAVEQEVVVPGLTRESLLSGHSVELEIDGGKEAETLYDGAVIAGRLVRTRFPLTGRLTVTASADAADPDLLVLRVDVHNTAALEPTDEESRAARRDLAARQSFVGTHLMLSTDGGSFVSLIDPPDWAIAPAARCGNARCWPVLIGSRGPDERLSDVVMGSPIILSDYPEIAEQSPGQLYDSAEIDEILTLRIMTMTDEEKAAARGTDPRAAAIIDRSDDLPPEMLERLHGVLHDLGTSPKTDAVVIDGVPVATGSRVVLKPHRRADAHDMFLAGQTAVVQRIDTDAEGERHVAVLLENDPAKDINEWYGRFYYFAADEVQPA